MQIIQERQQQDEQQDETKRAARRLNMHNAYNLRINYRYTFFLKFEVGLEPKRQQPKSNLLDACSNMKDRIQQTNFEEQLNH